MHTRGQVFLWLCRLLSAVWSQFRNNSPAAEYPEQQQGLFSEKESREDTWRFAVLVAERTQESLTWT